jgi:acyl-CoA synthetase (AMP-forming)/AMP-acid ligase II
MTEAPLVSFSVVANERRQWGSVGPLVPGIEVRITNIESGNALPLMATGEIWVRGPQVMKGMIPTLHHIHITNLGSQAKSSLCQNDKMLKQHSKISDHNYNTELCSCATLYYITEQVAKIIRFTHILVYNIDSIRAILWKILMHIHFAATVAVVTQKIRDLQYSRENIWSDCEIRFNYDGV